jgi:2'-5' RNA ligase
VPPSTLRTFVAVNFSPELRRALAEAGAGLSRSTPQRAMQWVKADNIHLTLKFLGDVPTDRIPEIAEALTASVGVVEPFQFTATGLGCFPNIRKPRVVWAGVEEEGARKLIALAAAVEAALNPLGFPKEARPFSPHLTLGRVRRETPPPDAARVGQAVAAQPMARWGTQAVSAIHLMKSDLQPGGSIYTTLHTANLGHSHH